jgi:hypothetical protein
MKRNLYVALTALVLALAINVAFAQSHTKAKADVPFAFAVEQNSMAAGHYSIIEVSERTLEIRNDDTNTAVTLIALHEESIKPQNARLVFHKYGDRYFLAEVWCSSGSAGSSGMEFPSGKLEQEMRAANLNSGGPSEVVVALR